MKSPDQTPRARVVVVGDTCVSQAGLETLVGQDKRYQVVAGAHGFLDAGELIERHKPDVLIIEPFLGDRDGILWIHELAAKYPKTRILIVSRRSERVYAERALNAGAGGYWMKNGSAEALLHAIETVASGEIYTSPAITSMIVRRWSGREKLPSVIGALSNRELAVFSLIAAGRRAGEIAKELGISRKTIHTHGDRIKEKLGYKNADELRRGARELLGEGAVSARHN